MRDEEGAGTDAFNGKPRADDRGKRRSDMRNRNDVGLLYMNDPVRIAETAAFKADKIRAAINYRDFKADADEMLALIKAPGPHYETITNSEDVLSTIRALSIVSLELQERFTNLGYEPGDFDDEDEDDEAA